MEWETALFPEEYGAYGRQRLLCAAPGRRESDVELLAPLGHFLKKIFFLIKRDFSPEVWLIYNCVSFRCISR